MSELRRSVRTYQRPSRTEPPNPLNELPVAIFNQNSSQESSSDLPAERGGKARRTTSGFAVKDHYDVVVDENGRWHRCKSEGCTKKFRETTSASHKKRHVELHQARESKAFNEWDRQMKLRYTIILIATCGLPFKLVESSIFRLMTSTNFDRHTIQARIKEEYNEKKQMIRHKLNGIELITITTDIWSCSTKNNEAYSCYIGHYLEEGEVKQLLLDFIPMPQSHTGSYLNEKLTELVEFFDIKDKIAAITADGASNNKCSIALFNSLLSFQNLPQVEFVCCFCHILNNVVQYATASLCETIEKARTICLAIKRSSNLNRALEEACRRNFVQFKKVLIDVDTRWNSLYLMLQRMVELKVPINSLTSGNLNLSHLVLEEEDWERIESLLQFLEPFYEYTLEMSRANEFTYSGSVIYYRKLIKHCEVTLQVDPHNNVSKLALEKLMTSKSKVETDYSLMATLMDPFMNRHLPEIERAALGEKLKGLIHVMEPYNSSLPLKTTRSKLFLPEVNEVERFLNESQPGPHASMAKWWNEKQFTYPKLFKIAMKFIIIRPSSVSAESTFSIASWFVPPKRNRLSCESIVALMFLHHYYQDSDNLPL